MNGNCVKNVDCLVFMFDDEGDREKFVEKQVHAY